MIFALAATAISACSLGAFTGYSSGGLEPDASADGATNEAGSEIGSGIDGSIESPSDASGDVVSTGCAGKFCDDFERTVVGQGWDQVTAENGGTVTSAQAPDPVHAGMRGARVAMTTDPAGRAFLERKLGTPASKASLTFWMNMPTPSRVLQVARIRLDEGGSGKGINFFVQTKSAGGVLVAEQYFNGTDYVGFASNEVTASFKPGTWQKWTLEVDGTVTPHRSRTTIDGVVVRDDPMVNSFSPGNVRAYLGISYAEAGGATVVFFDDVAIDFSP